MPRLAVSGLVQPVNGIERTGVNVAYVRRLVRAGGMPLVLSPVLEPGRADEVLSDMDGLLLSGGADIAPERYGTVPSPRLGAVEPERDAFELALFAAARGRGLPVLAICRGLQLVNVATGGTLWQDLPSERPGAITHQQAEPRSVRTHDVRLQPGSRTATCLGVDALRANSMHHQAVRDLGDGLVATGWAADGVIEALEARDGAAWLLGVQWHPEDLADGGPDDGLFREFVAAAARQSS